MLHGKRSSTTHGTWPSAVRENFYECASNDPDEPQLWVYTDRWSYEPGDTVCLHTSTSLASYDLTICRDGAEREVVLVRSGLVSGFHQTPEDCSVIGCAWPKSLEFVVLDDWRSGGYVVTLAGETSAGERLEARHLFILRAKSDSRTKLLQIAATGTWLAYNDWGGSNHYEGICGPNRDQFSPIVSILRPFSRGFIVLPDGAPRAVLRHPPEMGAAITYPHMDWAYANGYSKKYASAGWASYDRHFFRWAEAAGYGVDLCTLHDIHADPSLLEGYHVAVIVGHDEYWSKEMRNAIDAFVERGGRIARFAGNFMWQTRLEDGGRKQVCYKYRARDDDPFYRDPATRALTTTAWEALEVGRPGAETFGVNALRGLYAGWAGTAPRHCGGFTVYRPEHWALAGSDLYYGDVLGGQSRIFGYEVDGLEYTFRHGLPEPLGTDGAPMGIEVIAMGVATCVEENHGFRGTDHFIGEDDVTFAVEAIDGEVTPEAIARRRYGSGMIVNFKRGSGEVFTAGTCDWIVGLLDRDPFVERITHNVLDRFLDRTAGTSSHR